MDSLLGKDFRGKLQCDGYSAYPAFARGKEGTPGQPGLRLFGCWSHARRGFFEAQAQAPPIVGWLLNQIGMLYRWEAELRESRAGPAARQARRASHSRMVVARLKRALEKLAPRYLPKSPLGQAIGYALNQWPLLERFLEHGEVEIDNNLVENAIRPSAVGKKNWLFFGSAEAGTRNAVVLTLVQNCRMHGVDPYAYLKDLLERLPRMTNRDDLTELTPRRWQQAREKALKQAA